MICDLEFLFLQYSSSPLQTSRHSGIRQRRISGIQLVKVFLDSRLRGSDVILLSLSLWGGFWPHPPIQNPPSLPPLEKGGSSEGRAGDKLKTEVKSPPKSPFTKGGLL